MQPSAAVTTAVKLEFQLPKPEDAQWAQPLLYAAGRMGCEFCFGNIFAWSLQYTTEIARGDGFFFSRNTSHHTGHKAYCFPICVSRGCDERDVRALQGAVALLKEDAQGKKLRLYGLETKDVTRLEAAFPGKFTFEPDRDYFDYIYLQADLACLAGKKYHSKRNHIAHFVKNQSGWSYREITPGDLDECLAMAGRWEALHAGRDPAGLEQEARALHRAFAHYDDFGMRGGLVRLGGKLAAFTVGEPLNQTTFVTHFEKAYPDIPGAYQMINRCFAEQTLAGFKYINREEDLGNEGLRRAKLSYHPAMLLEKFRATEIL